MSDEIQVGATPYKKRVGKHIELVEGPPPAAPEHPKGRLPRITRHMALAICYEDLILQGHDCAEIALLGHVTRARVTQIMNLRLLAPDIQEQLIFLERIAESRARNLRQLQEIVPKLDWRRQREHLRTLGET